MVCHGKVTKKLLFSSEGALEEVFSKQRELEEPRLWHGNLLDMLESDGHVGIIAWMRGMREKKNQRWLQVSWPKEEWLKWGYWGVASLGWGEDEEHKLGLRCIGNLKRRHRKVATGIWSSWERIMLEILIWGVIAYKWCLKLWDGMGTSWKEG